MQLSEKAKQILGPKPAITQEEFLKELWPLKKKGIVEDAYIQAAHTIAFKKTFEGKPITLQLIVDKYKLYLEDKQREGADDKYIMKIESFVAKGGYDMEFDKTVGGNIAKFLK